MNETAQTICNKCKSLSLEKYPNFHRMRRDCFINMICGAITTAIQFSANELASQLENELKKFNS